MPTAGVVLLTDFVMAMSEPGPTMFSGASWAELGKKVHVSSPLASPKLPVHGAFVLPPAAAPNARWAVEVS